ncbi:protein TolR [Pelagibacterium xiamenense]|uniref:protein TolR n=1 Tax=Pelagibacterium xiamenense TaxID=2901140 RepID=UPI001E5614B1|nr:protein TolR [Pelagibacterium xiamenense]MCD7060453.1 protein TolR [Pelagibacterium xiamenense]
MGMAVNGGGRGGGRRRRGSRASLMSEINVTPFVDVMLVLLIIFMVAAPMMAVGVPIDLPETQASEMESERDPVTVSVTPEGQVFVGEDPVALDGLVEAVRSVSEDTEARLYVRGDASVNYGTVMEVMGMLSGAGYSRIGLITEQAGASGAGQ